MKVECKACGLPILPETADRNDRLCAPCKNGTIAAIQDRKQQLESERMDLFQLLFQELRDRSVEKGFIALTDAQLTYYSVSVFLSDLYRGAVQLFLDVNPPAFKDRVRDGLREIGSGELVSLLDEAARLFSEQDEWYASNSKVDEEPPQEDRLARITNELLQNEADIYRRLERYAEENRLIRLESE